MITNYTDNDIEHRLRSGEDEGALRDYFGPALYEALRNEANTPPAAFSGRARPKVYLLPGILGSSLEVKNRWGHDKVWIDPVELLGGGVQRLRLSPDDGVRPIGAVKLAYQLMLNRLRRMGLDVEELPFDWRKSTLGQARALMARLRNESATGVTLVGHSMGGLVARGMAGLDPERNVISRVITIATPNLGSFSPVQVFTLDHGMLGVFGVVDLVHSEETLAREFMRHFPGLVEMMPGDGHGPIDFFDREAWPNLGTVPLQDVLIRSYANKTRLPAPDARFIQIISVGERTVDRAVLTGDGLEFSDSLDGDGTVPRVLAEMGPVQRYYTHGSHPWLCNQSYIIDAVRDLVLTGRISDNTNFSTDPGRRHEAGETPELSVLEGRGPSTQAGEAELLNSLGTGAAMRAALQSAAVAAVPDIGEEIATGAGGDTGPHGYVMDHMIRAGAAWHDAESDRSEIERHVAQGTSTLAETPARLEKYERRLMNALNDEAPAMLRNLGRAGLQSGGETAASIDDLVRERIIGNAEEFLSVDFLKRGGLALKPVCRIVLLSGTQGFGTGFLIAPDVVMTNNHVLPDRNWARNSGAQFGYERDARRRRVDGRVFELDPDRLFLTNAALDFTLVAIRESAAPAHRNYGYLPLIGEEGKIRVTRPVNIIQHPNARRKEVIVRQSTLKIFPPTRDDFAHYTGDTLPGSSGSPVLNDLWEVVALHHSGVPDVDNLGRVLAKDGTLWNRASDPRGESIRWVANEGVRISRIMPKIAEASRDSTLPEGHRSLLNDVLDVGARAASDGAFFWLEEMMLDALGPMSDDDVQTPRPREAVREEDHPYEARRRQMTTPVAIFINP